MATQFLINFSQVIHVFLTLPTLLHHHGDDLRYPTQQHSNNIHIDNCLTFSLEFGQVFPASLEAKASYHFVLSSDTSYSVDAGWQPIHLLNTIG